MKPTLSSPTNLLLILLSAVLLFHVGVLVKWIPYTIAWGGRLTSDEEMYVFESISITINAFLMWVLCMNARYTRPIFSPCILRAVLWVFLVLFALNTLGNLFAQTNLEKAFSIVTAFFAWLIWRVVKARSE